MGLFCDIWIDKGFKPSIVRHGNKEWVEKDTYSVSLPDTATAYPYLSEVNHSNYKLLILGQFYESVDQDSLFKNIAAFIKGDSKEFKEPAGHYVLFFFDKTDQHTHVFTNRFGTYHAYVYDDGKNGAIGTFFLGMAKQAIKKDFDWEGMTGFLNMGFFPNDKTYFESIKILEPATHYHFDENLKKIHQKRYWNWEEKEENKPIEEHLHNLHTSLSTSLNTAVANKRVALPISGGLDSRTIAGILTDEESKSYSSIWGYSYGFAKGPAETKIANKIAQARHIPFHYYAVPRYLFDNIDLIAESTDLFSYIDGTRQASTVDMLKEKSEVVIGGHWGDVWLDDMGVQSQEDFSPFFRKKIVKKGADWFAKNICNNHLPDPNAYLNDYFQAEIAKYDYIKSPDLKMKIYKTDNWSFRWTLASTRMYQAGAMPILPFYDKNVAEALVNIPVDLLKSRELQIEYLKKYHKDLAKITWQEYGTNLYLYKKINNRNLVYRVFDKARRTITPGQFITRNWELFYLNEDGRRQLEEVLLGNNTLPDIVSREKIKQFIDDFYNNPTAANGFTMSMLHTLAQFVRIVL